MRVMKAFDQVQMTSRFVSHLSTSHKVGTIQKRGISAKTFEDNQESLKPLVSIAEKQDDSMCLQRAAYFGVACLNPTDPVWVRKIKSQRDASMEARCLPDDSMYKPIMSAKPIKTLLSRVTGVNMLRGDDFKELVNKRPTLIKARAKGLCIPGGVFQQGYHAVCALKVVEVDGIEGILFFDSEGRAGVHDIEKAASANENRPLVFQSNDSLSSVNSSLSLFRWEPMKFFSELTFQWDARETFSGAGDGVYTISEPYTE